VILEILQLYIGRHASAECSKLDSLAYAFALSIATSCFIDIFDELCLSQNILYERHVVPSDRFCRHTRESSLLLSAWTSRSCHILVRQLTELTVRCVSLPASS
jgi:hypothetical protein